jgi:cell division protein FtsN
VRVGSYKSREEARRTLDKLKKEGHKPILVLRQ